MKLPVYKLPTMFLLGFFGVSVAVAQALESPADNDAQDLIVADDPLMDTPSAEDDEVYPDAITLESLEEIGDEEPQLSVTDGILAKLKLYMPDLPFTEVTESKIPGLYEAVLGGQLIYVDETAEHLIDGEIIRFEDGTNITNQRLSKIHMSMIQEMDEKDMLIYEPEEPSDRSITVFTDIACGYCRLLHEEMDELLASGLRVRYIMSPRGGPGSKAFNDLVSVWCAENPQEAMTNAKAGGAIVPETCDNPIEEHIALTRKLGLRSTPLIYTDSGEQVNGYRPSDELATMVHTTEPLTF